MSTSPNPLTASNPLTTAERYKELRQWATSHAEAKRQTRSVGKDLLQVECDMRHPENPSPEIRRLMGVMQDIRDGMSESFADYSEGVARKLGLEIDQLEGAARMGILAELKREEEGRKVKPGTPAKNQKPLWVWELGGIGADRDPNSPKHDPAKWKLQKND